MKFDTRKVGNVLIGFAIVSTLYIYYPILWQEFWFRTQSTSHLNLPPKSSEFGLIIPKLGINETVVANVDPFNAKEYLRVLKQDVAHAKGSSLPDTKGNVYLFAHSSDNPFSITRYNTSFYLLEKLQPGDQISVYYRNVLYPYKVRELQTVKPWQVDSLLHDSRHQLILQTCTPVGTAINRLLVFADPI